VKVLILGVNGFIGSALTERILKETHWQVFGLDMAQDKIDRFLPDRRFHFLEGDIAINKEWIEYHIKKCDVVLPLVAIATPAMYVRDPLAVFELDFEENLRIVRHCVRYRKRIVFPSTSEIYGMCPDAEFDEETSTMVYGPISKQRWIYSSCKQLMDRVIDAYGQQRGLRFTLFRPFNWIGPNLDSIESPKEGSSRVLTQFLHNILFGEPIKLVDGGRQRRAFTYVGDGIDCLMKIIENRDGQADGGIFNIGNPKNDISIKGLAEKLVKGVRAYPGCRRLADAVKIETVRSENYYGEGYQDIMTRVPKIERARKVLGWTPRTNLDEAIRLTLDFYLEGAGPGARKRFPALAASLRRRPARRPAAAH
jgi:nucleoside-diphosphate-sugar epimerase